MSASMVPTINEGVFTCSRCHCKHNLVAFSFNRFGDRLKTCKNCQSRRPSKKKNKKPNKAPDNTLYIDMDKNREEKQKSLKAMIKLLEDDEARSAIIEYFQNIKVPNDFQTLSAPDSGFT